MVFKKITDNEIEETKSTKVMHSILEVKARIASAQGSVKNYQVQIKKDKELLALLLAAV